RLRAARKPAPQAAPVRLAWARAVFQGRILLARQLAGRAVRPGTHAAGSRPAGRLSAGRTAGSETARAAQPRRRAWRHHAGTRGRDRALLRPAHHPPPGGELMSHAIRHVVIVGRDAPAWLSACALQYALGPAGVDVTVVELPSRAQAADLCISLPALEALH